MIDHGSRAPMGAFVKVLSEFRVPITEMTLSENDRGHIFGLLGGERTAQEGASPIVLRLGALDFCSAHPLTSKSLPSRVVPVSVHRDVPESTKCPSLP
jgi:hypothetical protein